jgi:hypothetical protein
MSELDFDAELSLTSSTSSYSSPSVSGEVSEGEDSSWYEDTAGQVVAADCKRERLTQLLTHMKASSCFDSDDVATVEEEVQLVDRRIAAIHRAVSRKQWKLVMLFITLKRREALLERAVKENWLHPDEDDTLFQALVKKQVYLTRLAHEKIE